MKVLILVAHGSRVAASNDEVREVAHRLATRAGPAFSEVTAAFLELEPPSIADAVVAAVDRGASQVVVLPYFLSAGRHVAADIPGEVEKARTLRPDADVRIGPYLGSDDTLVDVLLALADAASA